MNVFAKLESQKTSLLRRLEGWEPTRLSFRPEPSVWCALDVLSHLSNVESGISKTIQNNLPAGGVPVTIKDRAGAFLVNSVMRSPMRVKVPPGAKVTLPKSAESLEEMESLEEISAQWSAVRQQLQTLLCSVPSQAMQRGFFRHPVAGWMSVPTAMIFLSAHLKHHGYQINRLERSFRSAAKL